MRKRDWIFQSNCFDVATQGSCKRMLIIATATDSKLYAKISDPVINAIYNNYHPVFLDYDNIYANYQVVEGQSESKTLNLKNLLLKDLPDRVRIWEPMVLVVYPSGSPEFKAIFPDGRKPFNSGAYETRISAVKALKMKLETDPLLSGVAVLVSSFYNVLYSARSTQQEKEGLLKDLSSQRENQRIVLAKALYTVLAGLMSRFAGDTEQLKNYFNLTLIREKSQAVAPDEVVVKGKVTIAGFETPVAKVAVVLFPPQGDPITKYTSAKGNYKFEQGRLNPGTGIVTLKVDAPGYEHYEYTFEATPGNGYDVNIALVPAEGMLKKVA